MTPAATRDLQQELNRLGYGPLVVDGIYGRATAAAYQLYLDEQPSGEGPPAPPAPPAPVPWWTSRALWGALATLVASAAGLAGYSLDAPQIAELSAACWLSSVPCAAGRRSIRRWSLAVAIALCGCQCAPSAMIALDPDLTSTATLAATLNPTEWRLGIRCQDIVK